jgi:hypothetical protein
MGCELGSCGFVVCKLPQAVNTTAVSTQTEQMAARLNQPTQFARPAGMPIPDSNPCFFCMYSPNLIDNDSHLV